MAMEFLTMYNFVGLRLVSVTTSGRGRGGRVYDRRVEVIYGLVDHLRYRTGSVVSDQWNHKVHDVPGKSAYTLRGTC